MSQAGDSVIEAGLLTRGFPSLREGMCFAPNLWDPPIRLDQSFRVVEFACSVLFKKYIALTAESLLGFQRSHVDAEAILHIALHHAFISFIDLLNRDNFYVSGDVVLTAEVEHFLRLGNTADW